MPAVAVPAVVAKDTVTVCPAAPDSVTGSTAFACPKFPSGTETAPIASVGTKRSYAPRSNPAPCGRATFSTSSGGASAGLPVSTAAVAGFRCRSNGGATK